MILAHRNFRKGDYKLFIQPLTKDNMHQLFIDNFGGWSDEVSQKKCLEVVEKGTVQLFFEEEKFIGYVSYEQERNNSNSILINDIHIKKEFQGKGYGTQILHWVESQIKNYSQIKIFVFNNNPAKLFYKKNEFKEETELSKSHTTVMIKKII